MQTNGKWKIFGVTIGLKSRTKTSTWVNFVKEWLMGKLLIDIGLLSFNIGLMNHISVSTSILDPNKHFLSYYEGAAATQPPRAVH